MNEGIVENWLTHPNVVQESSGQGLDTPHLYEPFNLMTWLARSYFENSDLRFFLALFFAFTFK